MQTILYCTECCAKIKSKIELEYYIIQLTKIINKGDRFICSEGKPDLKVWL